MNSRLPLVSRRFGQLFSNKTGKRTMSAQKFHHIVKSPEDDRSYRGLILENGLRAVLISDPNTDKSAASMDVNVGHFSDPRDLPGLAHFCEHMLFLGTEAFPDENEYARFLSQNNGYFNAYTSGEHTNYYFEVSPTGLPGALDRFCQFFLTPLFTESATEREVMAVNSEHEKNVQSDPWRINQLEHSLSEPDHDYGKFGTGNSKTLMEIPKSRDLDVRESLLAFHAKWYSSNIMGLAVLGKESLDELEQMVVERFCSVKDNDIAPPEWDTHPYGKTHCQTKTTVIPVKDLRSLHLTFPIPDLHPLYKYSPGGYLSHLVGHEGKGSLLSELKRRGWANGLAAGNKQGAKGFGFFIVNIDLTESGLDHIDNIITLVFQYLKLLKKEGPKEELFEEYKNLNAMTFRFKDKERPSGMVCNVSSCIHVFPIEEVLSGYYIQTDWKPHLVTSLLEKLVPESVRVMIISKKYESESDSDDWKREEWYGTKFKMEKISPESISLWKEAELNPNFALPHPNEFVPTNFDLADREKVNPNHPEIVYDSALSRLWFKQDDEYLHPKAEIRLKLISPWAYFDPFHTNLTHMFVQLVKDALCEYTYDAELAGLYYGLGNVKQGLELTIRGYNEKQWVLLEKLLTTMLNLKVDEERFKLLKEVYTRSLRNFKMEQPVQLAMYHLSVVLTEKVWLKDELLEELEYLTAEDVQKYIPRLFSKLYIESLIFGNYTEKQAVDTIKMVERMLTKESATKPLAKSNRPRYREVELKPNSHSLFESSTDVHKSSCIEIYYQCGIQSTRTNVVLELLAQILNEPCFDILRTKEQLGYIVFSGIRRASGVQGLRVVIQSDRHPKYLSKRIDNFLEGMVKTIEEMSDEDYEKHKEALAAQKTEKPKKLSGRAQRFWSEINSGYFNFNRDVIETDELKTVGKKEILNALNMFVLNKESRRKLSCHIVSKAEGGAGVLMEKQEVEDEEKGEEVTDLVTDPDDFKRDHAFHPLAKPFTEPESLKRQKLN